MNYEHELQRLITAIKADKSIVQPWKNKIVARLDECQAFIDRARKVTYMKPPEGLDVSVENDICTCIKYDGKIAGTKADCPVHGGKVK